MAGSLTDTAIAALWATLTGQSNAARIALIGTTAPTASAIGTEIPVGSGYTAGGKLLDETVTGSTLTAPTSGALTWTNSSGVSWPIRGALFHVNGAAAPTDATTKFFDDTLNLDVPDAGSVEILVDGITITVTS
jgi:hypothetical protein